MDTFESVVTELIEGLRSGEIVLDRNSQVQKAEVFRNSKAISKARLVEHNLAWQFKRSWTRILLIAFSNLVRTLVFGKRSAK